MKKGQPQKLPTCRIKIHRPDATISSDMEEKHKCYVPAAGPSGKSAALEPSSKPDKKISLRHNPLTKKKVNHLSGRNGCLALCRFPEYFENMKTTAVLFLLVLLSQVAHLLVGELPAMPVILLNTNPYMTASVIQALLNAVQGPDKWSGDDWSLNRPWLVRSRLALGDTRPSVSLMDYIGGKYSVPIKYGFGNKTKQFCFPFINSTFALMPDLPTTVANSIISLSPLAISITFERGKKADPRPNLELAGETFGAYDTDGIRKLTKYANDCYLEITLFLKWFCDQKKHIRRWKEDMDCFRPFSQRGRFTQPKSDTETEFLCAALSLFKQFLLFAVEQEWLTLEEANAFLFQYWRLVLPESAPPDESNTQDETVKLEYDMPEVFYKFLTDDFLPTYRDQVLSASSGAQGTMGLLHKIGDVLYFITPRTDFLERYAQWLKKHDAAAFDLSAHNGGAAVQRQLSEAGIPMRGEKGNPYTWRFKFYGKNGGSHDCLAFPILQLPEAVRSVFGQLFGTPSGGTTIPNGPEALPDGQEEVNCL